MLIKEAIYSLYNNQKLVYIGESKNVLLRLGNHVNSKEFNQYEIFDTSFLTERERFELEARMIEKYQPPLNVKGKAGKRKNKQEEIPITAPNRFNLDCAVTLAEINPKALLRLLGEAEKEFLRRWEKERENDYYVKTLSRSQNHKGKIWETVYQNLLKEV